MIKGDGYPTYSIWEHSRTVSDLYARRCRKEVEEMTCAAQAAELLAPLVTPGDTLLDAGCGSGYFYHSLVARQMEVEYHGIDASPTLIEIGRNILPSHGLPAERLRVLRIEDLDGEADHVVCMNVLTNIDNYHRPLERFLKMSKKSLLLRESLSRKADYRYVRDDYLDEGVCLHVHVNTYPCDEIQELVRSRGFLPELIEDRRTGGRSELVIGHPHHWTFLLARRIQS